MYRKKRILSLVLGLIYIVAVMLSGSGCSGKIHPEDGKTEDNVTIENAEADSQKAAEALTLNYESTIKVPFEE
ncbi:MAG TPA: hypothetical protein PLI20_10960, partial [Bacillota bacterium]|nr:hypothetical protein [Bacillota bacterium]